MKPFRETKAFEIIKRVAPELLKGLEGIVPGASIVSSIIDVIKKQNLPVSPEELASLHEFEREMYSMELQSAQGARDMNVAMNQSQHATWLAKNTPSLIALGYTVFNFCIYVMILFGSFTVDDNMAILIVNSITNIAMLIVSFYYGSSNRLQPNGPEKAPAKRQ